MALANPLWGDQRWSTFLKNHARAVVACDFFVTVTSTFRLLYVLVVIEHRSRRLIHCNVTARPTAAWTRQQLRQALGFDTHYGYLLHDRDSIFSRELDAAVGGFGLRVLKTPPHCPMANGLCERVQSGARWAASRVLPVRWVRISAEHKQGTPAR